MPGTQEPPSLGLVIGCRRSTLDALRSVFLQPALELGRAGTYGTVAAELNDLTAERVTGGTDPEMELKAVLSFPGVWFRGPEESFTLGPGFHSPVMEFPVFPGITGKVTDAMLRFTDVTDIKVTDSAGSFIRYSGTVSEDYALRVDTSTGRGWLCGLTDWYGGTEVNPTDLTFGRGPGFLTITPSFTDPFNRAGALTVSVGARGPAASITVKGKNAYHV
jgi:hypothetical protein